MTLQALFAKLILKLPDRLKVWLAGGRPLVLGGRTLDPALQLLTYAASKRPPLSSLPVEQVRAAEKEGLKPFTRPAVPGVQWEDSSIRSPRGHRIPVRIYRPARPNPTRPALTYFHMGGGVIGTLDTCHDFCQLLTDRVGCPIVSVDYRLAPEHIFPAGLEDCIDAYEWTLAHSGALGAVSGHAMVGGDSMGGNFSAVITQEMIRQGKPPPDLQLLIYPATDFVTPFDSQLVYGDTYPLSTATMDWFKAHYLPDTAMDLADPRLSPAQTTRLAGLPPAVIATAGFDPLTDDGAAYARKLDAAGVPVQFQCFDSLAHGFVAFMGITPAAHLACQAIADMVIHALEQRT
jgi:acetyl esterase/lipase